VRIIEIGHILDVCRDQFLCGLGFKPEAEPIQGHPDQAWPRSGFKWALGLGLSPGFATQI